MAEACAVKKLSPLQAVIAARMVEAKQTIPHFRVRGEIPVAAMLALREELRREPGGVGVTLNHLFVKACAMALMEVPEVNLQWSDDNREIHQYADADISIVTAVEGGMVTPIIRRANTKSIWEISHELKDLASRAARHALKMPEIVGGSFSISNLGMHGVEEFDAIINPPQCAILAIGSARPRWVIADDRQPKIVDTIRVSLSCDHRAIDGVTAAKFLAALRSRIEDPCLHALERNAISR